MPTSSSPCASSRAEGRQFDLIVLDPPKFAPSSQHIDCAARAYAKSSITCGCCARGGLLFTPYSCSGAISMELFQKIVAGAATDARADACILRRLSAGTDHPMLAAFPEGEYLKGLLLEKM